MLIYILIFLHIDLNHPFAKTVPGFAWDGFPKDVRMYYKKDF